MASPAWPFKALKGGQGDEGGGGLMSSLTGGVFSKLGGGGDDEGPSTGWGRGRRNPVQRWVDIAVPGRPRDCTFEIGFGVSRPL